MHLSKLLQEAGIETSFPSLPSFINKISCDSRDVEQGDLFVSIPCTDSFVHAQCSLEKGAKVIVDEQNLYAQLQKNFPDVFFVNVPNSRIALARLASAFYGAQPDAIVAVTGTNGKSSVVNMVRQFWYAAGEKSASLGSLGLVINPDFISTKELNLPKLNSLDAINFHKTLAYLKVNEVNHLAMEASSHGLDQARLHSAHLTAAAFTNLTQDHLDYHHTMDEYFAAKAKLFTEILPENKTAVLNADSPYFFELNLRNLFGDSNCRWHYIECRKSRGSFGRYECRGRWLLWSHLYILLLPAYGKLGLVV